MSRYYDPSTGRFVNADVYLDTGTSIFGTNMYAYCDNNPSNYIDPMGHKRVAYYYTVTSFWIRNIFFVFYYDIVNGVIKFDFTKNRNYAKLYSIGGSYSLAKEMYNIAKKLNGNYLAGRTIGGINVELKTHYLVYTLGRKLGQNISSAKVADMGGTDSKKIGYDSNAWFFESSSGLFAMRQLISYSSWPLIPRPIFRNVMRYV